MSGRGGGEGKGNRLLGQAHTASRWCTRHRRQGEECHDQQHGAPGERWHASMVDDEEEAVVVAVGAENRERWPATYVPRAMHACVGSSAAPRSSSGNRSSSSASSRLRRAQTEEVRAMMKSYPVLCIARSSVRQTIDVSVRMASPTASERAATILRPRTTRTTNEVRETTTPRHRHWLFLRMTS